MAKKNIVIDTNVLMIAEDKNHLTEKCSSKCANKLMEAIAKGIIHLDFNGEIIKEYSNNIRNCSQQPGMGAHFLIWLFNNQHNLLHCKLVDITSSEAVCFPTDESLASFDPSDKKFVRVAINADPKAKILQCADLEKWKNWEKGLNDNGVSVEFIAD